jgi:hypothetical protein
MAETKTADQLGGTDTAADLKATDKGGTSDRASAAVPATSPGPHPSEVESARRRAAIENTPGGAANPVVQRLAVEQPNTAEFTVVSERWHMAGSGPFNPGDKVFLTEEQARRAGSNVRKS